MTDVGVGDGEWGQPSPPKKFQGREEVCVCVGGGGGGGEAYTFVLPTIHQLSFSFLKADHTCTKMKGEIHVCIFYFT